MKGFTPGRFGKLWSKGEEKQLVARFKAELPIAEIAKLHQRTIGAVLGRLVLLDALVNESGRYYLKDSFPDIVLYVDMVDNPPVRIENEHG